MWWITNSKGFIHGLWTCRFELWHLEMTPTKYSQRSMDDLWWIVLKKEIMNTYEDFLSSLLFYRSDCIISNCNVSLCFVIPGTYYGLLLGLQIESLIIIIFIQNMIGNSTRKWITTTTGYNWQKKTRQELRLSISFEKILQPNCASHVFLYVCKDDDRRDLWPLTFCNHYYYYYYRMWNIIIMRRRICTQDRGSIISVIGSWKFVGWKYRDYLLSVSKFPCSSSSSS